jgi:hypothetical protein
MNLISSDSGRDTLRKSLQESDLWITAVVGDQREQFLSEAPNVEAITVPTIYFPAFHPDLVKIFAKEGQAILGAGTIPYSSAIVYRSYVNGISADRCSRLFRSEIFESLGYFDQWSAHFSSLRKAVEGADLNFERFVTPLLRSGVFMHSSDHPKITALIEIARQIAERIGTSKTTLDVSMYDLVPDGLASSAIWPTYPGIAELYGAVGHFIWRLKGDLYARSPSQFVDLSYAAYDTQDLSGSTTRTINVAKFDAVLRNHA